MLLLAQCRDSRNIRRRRVVITVKNEEMADHRDFDIEYDEIRFAKSCKKLKLKDLGYTCKEIEIQK